MHITSEIVSEIRVHEGSFSFEIFVNGPRRAVPYLLLADGVNSWKLLREAGGDALDRFSAKSNGAALLKALQLIQRREIGA